MKAVTIQQPVASFLVTGKAHYLARPVNEEYRGRIALHAGAKLHPARDMFCEAEPFATLLRELGVWCPDDLPRGKVIAVGNLIACTPAQYLYQRLSAHQYRVSLLQPGRHAWIIRDIQLLPEPVPHKGRPDVFDLEPRAVRAINEQLRQAA